MLVLLMTAATGAWAQSTHRITATAGYAPHVQSATMDVTLPFESNKIMTLLNFQDLKKVTYMTQKIKSYSKRMIYYYLS